jgi:hypothetical protein
MRKDSSSEADMRIAACLVFRNAAPYLVEWILFHAASGIHHFYLYNNDSTDDFRGKLQAFDRSGLITLIDYPGCRTQSAIYADCITRAKGRFDWVAFIDDDEFLFCQDGSNIGTQLAAFPTAGGVAVSWFLYGSSGHIYAGDDLVVNRFIRRHEYVDHHHKCIMRPDACVRPLVVGHFFETVPGKQIVDQSGQVVSGPLSERPVRGNLRLNHYLTKSIEEMVIRRLARDMETGDTPKLPIATWFKNERGWNDVIDTSAHVMLPKMLIVARELGVWPC